MTDQCQVHPSVSTLNHHSSSPAHRRHRVQFSFFLVLMRAIEWHQSQVWIITTHEVVCWKWWDGDSLNMVFFMFVPMAQLSPASKCTTLHTNRLFLIWWLWIHLGLMQFDASSWCYDQWKIWHDDEDGIVCNAVLCFWIKFGKSTLGTWFFTIPLNKKITNISINFLSLGNYDGESGMAIGYWSVMIQSTKVRPVDIGQVDRTAHQGTLKFHRNS